MNQGMPYVWETAQQLRELISKAPNKQTALRLQLLYLLATQQAASRTQASALLGLNRDTIAEWLSTYEKGGLPCLLDIAKPSGLPSSLPSFVVEAMRHKLQEPAGLASFKALHCWVEQQFQLHTTYRVIHYTASQILDARLAVGRRSHVKKKKAMRRPFEPVFKAACNWLCTKTSRFIGKLPYFCSPRKVLLLLPKSLICR